MPGQQRTPIRSRFRWYAAFAIVALVVVCAVVIPSTRVMIGSIVLLGAFSSFLLYRLHRLEGDVVEATRAAKAFGSGDRAARVGSSAHAAGYGLASAFNAAADVIACELREFHGFEQSARLMRKSIDGSRDAVYWFDETGAIIDANQAACECLGYPRDELLGLEPTDYDVATDATPPRVEALFARTQSVGASFGVVLVRLGGVTIEVATFRADGPYSDSRRPDEIQIGRASCRERV